MDRGTDALAMLRNEVLPLKLGYIACINRSQQDIQRSVPVGLARRNESEFFAAHSEYRHVLPQCGIPALSRRCAAANIRRDHVQLQKCSVCWGFWVLCQ